MKSLIIGALTLILLTGCGFKNWSTYDKSMYVASWVITAVDVGQTRYIYDHPDEYYETNKIITTYFDNKNAATGYLIGVNIVGGIIADVLPSPYRSVFLTGWTGSKGYVVFNNNKIGIEWKW